MATKLSNCEKKALRNKHFLSKMKTERKKYLAATQQNKEASKSLFKSLDSTLQKMKSKGILHKNKVSRLLSRLAKKKEI